MNLKENIAGVNFKAMKNGLLKPNDALRFFGKFDFILSRKLSNAGRFLRKSQLEFISNGVDPKNRRAWISVLFPTEILYPFGIQPLSLEVFSGIFATVGLSQEFLNRASSAGVPNTMCSFHRLLIGLSSSAYFAPPEFVAATSLFCDGNLKSFSEAASANNRPFFYLDIPYEYNDASVAYLKEQLKKLVLQIAGDSSRGGPLRPLEDLIRESVILANEGLKKLKRIYELRKAVPQNIFRAYEMINFCFPSSYLLGSDILIRISDRIISALEKRCDHHKYFKHAVPNKNAKRLMWMHIVPQYDTELWDLIDNGETARVVCEEYTTPYFDCGYDLSDPLGSIAKRLITHPSNGPVERRIKNALKIAQDFNVDGVIHYSSWGCHQAAGSVSMIECVFEKNGFKFLNLNGDAVDKNNTTFGQHKTRIEAFLERM